MRNRCGIGRSCGAEVGGLFAMPPLVGLCDLVEPLESVLLFLCLNTSGGPFGELSVGILFYWEFFFYMRFDVL